MLLNYVILESVYGKSVPTDQAVLNAYRKDLTALVESDLLQNYKVLAACKKYLPELDITDEEIQKSVESSISETIRQFSDEADEDAFWEATEAMNMTEHFVRFTVAVTQMEYKLGKKLANMSELDFEKWILDGNGVYVQHILMKGDRQTAEEVRKKLADGTYTLSYVIGYTSYNTDLKNVSPYYVVRNVYETALENAAFALENVGDVSPVIETEQGYYILVRMEDKQNSNLQTAISEMLSSYEFSLAEDAAEEMKSSLSIIWNDYGKSIDLTQIQ